MHYLDILSLVDEDIVVLLVHVVEFEFFGQEGVFCLQFLEVRGV